MNMTEEDSEEEILVFAEFEDSVDVSKYRNIHVLGVDDRKPVVQLDDTFFTGNYENSLGTYMFFEHDPEPKSLHPLFDKLPEKNLKYVVKTRKCMKMQHAYVTPKEGKEPNNQAEERKEDDPKPVTFNSIQEGTEAIVKLAGIQPQPSANS